jgi:putative DNA-invertase from lambdoid prophage Rac
MYAQPLEQLATAGVRVHCLALGGVDLTSPAGKMTMQVIAAVAEFERDLLIERTQAGIMRAKVAGKRFGRSPTFNEEGRVAVMKRLGDGASIAEVAREFKTTRQTILRVKDSYQTR